MRIIDQAAERDPELFKQMMGFPDDLPDLARLRPPQNARPEAINECYFAQRERGNDATTRKPR